MKLSRFLSRKDSPHLRLEVLVGFSLLVVLLAYNYAYFFKYSYLGFRTNPVSAVIEEIFIDKTGHNQLIVGDQLVRIGDWQYLENLHRLELPAFPYFESGKTIPLIVIREGEEKEIEWIVPGFNKPQFLYQLRGVWFIAYVFWFFGFLTSLTVRPRDIRWLLFITFMYLLALWIMIGSVSYSGLWLSSLIVHSLTWIIFPVSLHFHWIFPQPLINRDFPVPYIFYGTGIVLAIASWFQWVPFSFYLLGIVLSVLGSFLLMILHVWFPGTMKKEIRNPLTLFLIVFLLAIEISVLFMLSGYSLPGFSVLFLMPILPGIYFVVIKMGYSKGLQIRTNRTLGHLVRVALIALITLILLFFFRYVLALQIPNPVFVIGITLIIGYGTFYAANFLVHWFNKKIIGIPLDSSSLAQKTTSRLATSLELEGFVEYLRAEIFPSLLIKQVLIIRFTSMMTGAGSEYSILLSSGVPYDGFPKENEIQVISQSLKLDKNFKGYTGQITTSDWWLIAMPLVFNNEIIGLCLFGRHDPDDMYSLEEIHLLKFILNQLAFAVVHSEQTEHLRAFYISDVQQMEEERHHLARELHDDILSQLALMVHQYHNKPIPFEYIQSIQDVIRHIRQMIVGLRSSALNYGLKPALDDLMDQLLDQYENNRAVPTLSLDLNGDKYRYPPEVELNIYRIAQQACQNAILHSCAKSINISGLLLENNIRILIKDDGNGFLIDPDPKLETLLSGGHFGLVGMYERAAFINAKLGIQSKPLEGTQIEIVWINEHLAE